MTPYALRSYRKTFVHTADNRSTVLYLMDAAIRAGRQAQKAIEERRERDRHRFIDRALTAVSELAGALDLESGGVANKLNLLYAYVIRSLIAANSRNDVEPLNGALGVMRIVREAWEQIATGPLPETTDAPEALSLNA